jgi:hypothetical protein
VTFEATKTDLEFIAVMENPVSIDQFEQIIDVYEKMTATAEFMESKENGLKLINEIFSCSN